jgi:hypothetical protein
MNAVGTLRGFVSCTGSFDRAVYSEGRFGSLALPTRSTIVADGDRSPARHYFDGDTTR